MDTVCYIFGAGEYFDESPAPGSLGFIIAADGGFKYLKERRIAPDLVIGDFDSLAYTPRGDCGNYEIIRLPVEKDDTDMVAAAREGWRRGYREFHIYGGTGGRLDHTLANIALVADIAARGGRAYLYGAGVVITALRDGSVSFPEDARGTISVFSYSDKCVGVTETGLKYGLTDAVMTNLNPNGVSNEFTGRVSSVSVKDGTLVVIYETDKL